ncbi:DHHC palmitoyltransferase-domain-containing protein [Lipomyces orientalis]|uniref:DHHC palmitoyltransferase-domain-containing protein n=1 Tax=Lipomyces orientalis TaxID=1233043 RepID=A0ACC3TUH5_9ASCO
MPASTEPLEPAPGHVQLLSIDEPPHHLQNQKISSGKGTFCLHGRVQNSGHRSYLLLVFAAIAIPAGLFFGFTAPWIWNNISQALPVVFSYLLLLCIVNLVRAVTSDPGILPRNIHTETSIGPGSLNIASSSVTVNCRQYDEDNLIYLPINYCAVCKIWRPARASHCRDCDSCIDIMDHHCVWLNNCVGARNYRYFFWFIWSLSLLGYFMSTLGFVHVLTLNRQKSSSMIAAIRFAPVSFALAIYSALGSIYPTSLGLYHIFLMSRGENTREFVCNE